MVLKNTVRLSALMLAVVLAQDTWAIRAKNAKLEKAAVLVTRFKITNLACKFQERVADRWVPTTKSFSADEIYPGVNSSVEAGKIIFKNKDGDTFSGDQSCFSLQKDSASISFLSHFSVYFFTGFSSFKDSMSIHDDAGTSSPLRVNNVAICTGLGLSYTHHWYDISLDSCGFYGKANLTNAEEAANIGYTALNASIFGVQNTIHLLWEPPSGQVDIGVAIPLNIKSGVWPVPDPTLGVSPPTGFYWGLMMEARFERGQFLFTQNLGFLGKPYNYIWNIQAAWLFE